MPNDGGHRRWSRFVDRIADLPIVSRLRTLDWARPGAAAARALHAFPDKAERLRKFVTSVALVGGIAIGTWIIIDLSNNEPLMFDAINVQQDLASRVPLGDRMAARIGAYFDQFTATIEVLRDRNETSLARVVELPKLEVPGTEVSVQSVVQIVRRFLGNRERRIGGDVFLSPASLVPQTEDQGAVFMPACTGGTVMYVVIRLTVNRGELAEPAEWPACIMQAAGGKPDVTTLDANMLESLLQLAALRAYERVNPCGSATYYFHNWYRRSIDGRVLDPDFRRASAMVSACIATRGSDEAGYAHHVLGRIRQASGRSAEAPDFFESAQRLHLRSHHWWRRGLHKIGLWPVHLPDLYAHWGSALMDMNKTAEALEKFDQEIARGSRSALGYLGKGNALSMLAGSDEKKLAEAVAVYCTGARRYRFDAEIRHVLADALESHRNLRKCSKKPGDTLAYVLTLRRKAVDLVPAERKYLLALGRSLRAQGEDAAAVVAFNQVLRLADHDGWDAYTELAATYTKMRRPELSTATYRRAQKALGRLAELRPHDAQVRYLGALASLAIGEHGEAHRLASDAVARDPALQVAWLALACAEWNQGRTDAAIVEYYGLRQLEAVSRQATGTDLVLKDCVAALELLAPLGPP